MLKIEMLRKNSYTIITLLLFIALKMGHSEIVIKIPVRPFQKPSTPGDVRIFVNDSVTATGVWTRSLSTSSVIYGIEVFKVLNNEDDASWKKVLITFQPRVLLVNLEPSTTYSFYVTASNEYGSSPRVRTTFATPKDGNTFTPQTKTTITQSTVTTPQTITHPIPIVPTVPQHGPDSEPEIIVKSIGESSITIDISYYPSFQEHQNHYLVYKPLSDDSKQSRSPVYTKGRSPIQYTLTNLSPSTTYVLWIEISAKDGEIHRTIPIHVKTSKPAIPKDPEVNDFVCDGTCQECVRCSIIDPLMRDSQNVDKLKEAIDGLFPNKDQDYEDDSIESAEEIDFM